MQKKLLKFHSFVQSEKDIYIAKSIFNSSQNTIPHHHDFYELFFVNKGTCLHFINEEKFFLGEGNIQFIYSDNVHCFSALGNEPAVITNIAFSKEVIEKIDSDFFEVSRNENAFLKPIKVSSYQWRVIEEKIEWMSTKKINRNDVLKSLLFDYISLYEITQLNINMNNNTPLWLMKAMELFKKEADYTNGIKNFIKLTGKSQEYTIRQMKKYFNQTPTQWINGLRLEKAKEFLILTDMSILDIIYECGFNNESYFFSLFKKNFSVSPKKFREINSKIFMK